MTILELLKDSLLTLTDTQLEQMIGRLAEAASKRMGSTSYMSALLSQVSGSVGHARQRETGYGTTIYAGAFGYRRCGYPLPRIWLIVWG